MGLNGRAGRWLACAAATRPHALIVAVPGQDATRIAAEAAVLGRGGVLAAGPADADILLIAGRAGAELGAAIERVWSQMPGPRARVQVAQTGDVEQALDCALDLLRDDAAQHRDAVDRTDNVVEGPHRSAATDGDEHGDQRTGHGQHGHDMGGMAMELPGRLPMADRGPDRDGLTLDVLHVALGPVLPDWPAGLVVEVEMQGDVIQNAQARFLDAAHQADAPNADTVPFAVLALDALAQLLSVADWPDAASATRALRDHLDRDPPVVAVSRVERLGHRLRRSRTLALRGRGLGVVSDEYPDAALRGDVTARWHRWLDLAGQARTGAAITHQPTALRERTELACRLIAGLDLAAARLVIASLDLRTPQPVTAAPHPAGPNRR